jgi:PAS domain S-box-containing protein
VDRLPEIAELHTFLLAADARSLSGAARRLHLSPAAVAKRLDNLEAVLGYPLLKRGPRGVDMTPAGRAFYAQAERLVRDAERLLDGQDVAATERLSGVRHLFASRVRSADLVLADVERLMGFVLDSVSAGVLLRRVDDAVVLEANEAFCELVGVPRDELIGRRCPGADNRAYEDALATLRPGDPARRASTVFRTAAGTERAVEAVSRRIDLAGEDAYLLVIEDVSHFRDMKLRLATRVRRQRNISRLGSMISSGTEIEEVLGATLELVNRELSFDSLGLLDIRADGTLDPQLLLGPNGEDLVAVAERYRRTWSRGETVAEFEGVVPDGTEPSCYVVCVPLPCRRSTSHVLVARGGRTTGIDSDGADLLRSAATLCAAALTAAGELAA